MPRSNLTRRLLALALAATVAAVLRRPFQPLIPDRAFEIILTLAWIGAAGAWCLEALRGHDRGADDGAGATARRLVAPAIAWTVATVLTARIWARPLERALPGSGQVWPWDAVSLAVAVAAPMLCWLLLMLVAAAGLAVDRAKGRATRMLGAGAVAIALIAAAAYQGGLAQRRATQRACFAVQRTAAGCLEMYALDKNVPLDSLRWNAAMIEALYDGGYFDGGDHECPGVWPGGWIYYRAEKGRVRCLYHGSVESPRPAPWFRPRVPMPPRAPLPAPLLGRSAYHSAEKLEDEARALAEAP